MNIDLASIAKAFVTLMALSASLAMRGVDGDTLRILMTGDVLLDRGVRQKVEREGPDAMFSAWADSLTGCHDIVVANLECPATKVHAPVQKWYIFRGEPEWLTTLRRHGITHVNLANNHSIDQGRRGLMDTRTQAEAAGLVPFGAGADMEEAAAPLLLATTPRPVWVLASMRLALENFAYLPERPSVSQESFDRLVERVAALRRADPSAYIIATLHWGGENRMHPTVQQKMEAHRLVDAGADIVVGHHSHTLQDIETYRGHAIYYSIGNFIFDLSKPHQRRACAVSIKVTGTASVVETIPVEITDCVPQQPVL